MFQRTRIRFGIALRRLMLAACAWSLVTGPAPAAGDAGTDATGIRRGERAGGDLVPGQNGPVDALGLDLQWIPPGRFRMGSTEDDRAWARGPEGLEDADWQEHEHDPVETEIPTGFWMSRTHVTRGMFARFIRATNHRTDSDWHHGAQAYDVEKGLIEWRDHASWRNPGFAQVDNHPVVAVSWHDAMAFCAWLTRIETEAGRVPEGYEYRLPGEAEWEYAARGGREGTRFWWGDRFRDGRGRINGPGTDPRPCGEPWKNRYEWSDGFAFTSPVDRFGDTGRNGFGLADMLGNAWQWCYDGVEQGVPPSPVIRSGFAPMRAIRGGAFITRPGTLRCGRRQWMSARTPSAHTGFRVVLGPAVAVDTPEEAQVQEPENPEPGQKFRLAFGMRMRWIPPGPFRMGSTPAERAWAAANGVTAPSMGGETDPARTRIETGFWMGKTPVTRGQFARFVEATGYRTDAEQLSWAYAHSLSEPNWSQTGRLRWHDPGFFQDDDHPVVAVSWNDAMAFCAWLTRTESEAGRVPEGYEYRLAGEAEWEYAARGGREGTWFWWGDRLDDGRGRLNLVSKDLLPNWQVWTLHVDWSDGFAYTSPVDHYGEKGRNGFGLADMHGNVREWCYDGFDSGGPAPWIIPSDAPMRVQRGGSYADAVAHLRCAARLNAGRRFPSTHAGFRVVLGPRVAE